jgi:hypothetical protein
MQQLFAHVWFTQPEPALLPSRSVAIVDELAMATSMSSVKASSARTLPAYQLCAVVSRAPRVAAKFALVLPPITTDKSLTFTVRNPLTLG